MNSDYADAYIGLGTVAEKTGNQKRAKKMFDKARKLNPKSIATDDKSHKGKAI